MNTRQKLTLGIAAIFMVTLTIIGVTYAYFVTRVNYTGTETTAIIETAEIGSSINIQAPITINNAIPGATTWKAFAVSTASQQGVPFSIMITTSLNPDVSKKPEGVALNDWNPGLDVKLPEFIHSQVLPSGQTQTNGFTVDSVCYVENVPEGQTKDDCYKGTRYDNIELTLYRVHSNSGHAVYPTTVDAASYDKLYERADVLDSGLSGLTEFPKETFSGESDSNGDGVYELKLARNDKIIYADLVPVDPTNPSGAKEQNVLAPYNNSYVAAGNHIVMGGSQIVPKKNETPATNSYNLYVLKVTYKNVLKNQNIENDASVNIKIDITGSAEVTN